MFRYTALVTIVALATASAAQAQDRDTKVRNDRDQLKDSDVWVYNDFDRGVAEAKRTGKPLMVVLRCIPCEACSEFDKALLADVTVVRDLFDKFVCVRVVQGNSLDLSLFQFDYDQSFHIMFFNADKTIYGRYGTRSARPEREDMTMKGLRQAMLAVLDLHKNYPDNKARLAGKQSKKTEFAVPEEMPELKGKYGAKLDYAGEVVRSCIHCHQIRDAQRSVYRQQNKPLPLEVLYPFPLPETIGLRMNPDAAAEIADVAEGSIAARAGLQEGDNITSLAGQPLLSTADLQWVLHNAPESGELVAVVTGKVREGGRVPLTDQTTLKLPQDWRERSDISWRVSTWHLRGLGTGGLVLEDLSDDVRRDRGIADDVLALRVKHVGLYGQHAAAKNAGFQKDDVITSVGELTGRLSEGQFLAHALTHRAGEKLPTKVLRGRKTVELKLPIQ
ncbi:MAG: Trx7/PDZ domain-containing (seleno)protein [Pirellulales bacterium]